MIIYTFENLPLVSVEVFKLHIYFWYAHCVRDCSSGCFWSDTG